MTRYLLTVLFVAIVIGLYHFIDIRLFNLDLTKQVKNALFVIRTTPQIDPTVVLYSLGKLQPEDLKEKIDSLLIAGPRKIGINLCHFDKIPKDLISKYESDDRVVFANCEDLKAGALSLVINDEGTVTHFKTEKPDYFELKLTGFKGRGNGIERINYGPRLDYPINKGELTNTYFWFNPSNLKDKTILLGYMGDYLTDSIYYYKNCRITPLNQYYGMNNILPDMYDIEISANIIRTINDNDFINEINQIVRILIILAFSFINVIILTFTKTKWTIVNLIIATVLFILSTGVASFFIVFMFDKGYFLEMDELPLILLITTAFTVILNFSESKASSNQT